MNDVFQLDVLFPAGALLLAIALVYGILQYRSRNRSEDAVAQRVVKERYEEPSKWDGNRN